MFPELSAWGYAGGLADDLRPRIARIGTDIRTSKGEMRGSLHCGGKCAASGRDDGIKWTGQEFMTRFRRRAW